MEVGVVGVGVNKESGCCEWEWELREWESIRRVGVVSGSCGSGSYGSQ